MKHKNTIKLRPKALPAWVAGWWQDIEDDVAVRFHFSFNKEATELTVRAFNSFDGEEMKVKNLALQDQWLVFTTICESTKFQAGHKWRFSRGQKALHEVMLPEIWLKVKDDRYDYLLSGRRGSARKFDI